MIQKKDKPLLYLLIVSACVSLLWMIAVMTLDVAPIGPMHTRVGLSHLNAAARDAIGFRPVWYEITKWIGYISLAVAFAQACAGIVQMIKRKSFFRADFSLRMLGVIYAIVIAMYIFFELVIINYRPVIMSPEEGIEASFPSSHTLMTCVIFGCAIPLLARVCASRTLRLILTMICVLMITLMVFGRLFCGVHWLSDIIASLFFSVTLVLLYCFLLRLR